MRARRLIETGMTMSPCALRILQYPMRASSDDTMAPMSERRVFALSGVDAERVGAVRTRSGSTFSSCERCVTVIWLRDQ